MPELPEVETVRLGLESKLSGFIIHEVEVLKERTIASKGGSKDYISKNMLKELSTYKHASIGSHSMNHQRLTEHGHPFDQLMPKQASVLLKPKNLKVKQIK